MKDNLPVYIEPAIGETSVPAGLEALRPGTVSPSQPAIADSRLRVAQALPLEQYESVCLEMRETRLVASKDPGAFSQCFSGTVPPVCKPARAKRQLFGMPLAQAAGWICVVQLGAIIWILTGGPLHVDGLSFDRVRTTLLSAAAPAIGCLTHNGLYERIPEPPLIQATGRAAKALGKRTSNKSKHQSRTASGKDQQWPRQANFVPPPPPIEPTSGMMVPPPPVAYSLWQKGAGAAGASNLGTTGSSQALAEPLPAATVKHAPAASGCPSLVKKASDSAAVAVQAIQPTPAVGNAPVAVATKGADSSEVLLEGMPAVAPESKTIATQVLAGQSSTPISPLPPQMVTHSDSAGKCYTVMAGSRKRLITDR
jgi:hypothetical protein